METKLLASDVSLEEGPHQPARSQDVPGTSAPRRLRQCQVFLIVLVMIHLALFGLTPISHADELKLNDNWRFQLDPESKRTILGWAGPELDDTGWPVLQAGK